MAIFKKKNHREIRFEENDGGRTPVKFSSKKTRSNDVDKRAKRKKIRRLSILIISIGIVAALAFFGYKAWNAIQNVFEGDGNLLNLFNGQTQYLKGEKEGRTNVLLIGVGGEEHTAGTLADTVILASIDYKTKYVAMFSIPRDLYVKIPGDGYSKINAAHAFGERDKYPGGGPALLKKTVEENFGVPIHYYARVDFDGLKQIVDALGGVNIDIENSFCDYSYPVGRPGDTRKVCFTKGNQTLNGTKALQYSRSRHAYGVEGSDFARSRRQQKLLMGIKEKAISANTAFNPKKVLDVLKALGDRIKTDFQITDFSRLYDLSKEIDQSRVISKNFDNGPGGYLVSSSSYQTGYILKPKSGNFDELKKVVKNIFSVVYVKEEKASIRMENGGYSSYSFNNVVSNMKTEGYNIVGSSSVVNKYSNKTQIIDYSGGKKPQTIKALEEKFGVTAITASSESAETEIKVIVGRYFKG